MLEPGAKVEKLAGGFYNISGGAVDPAGDFYFVDAHWQRIYRWTAAARQLSTVADQPLDPVNLAIDKAGNIIVASYTGNGTVYTLRPDAPTAVTVLQAQPVASRAGMRAALPVSDWHLNMNDLSHAAGQFVSPDGTTFLPVGQGFLDGAVSFGVKSSGQLRSFGLALASAGQLAYVTDESDQTTWVGTVNPDGSLANIKLFAYQGGEGVAVDANGNVYIAAGQITSTTRPAVSSTRSSCRSGRFNWSSAARTAVRCLFPRGTRSTPCTRSSPDGEPIRRQARRTRAQEPPQ